MNKAPPPGEHTPQDASDVSVRTKKPWSKPTISTMTGVVNTVTGATTNFMENVSYNPPTS